jgi:NAD(P) transhydrogenase subunit alpha
MKIAVAKEVGAGECRVALVPDDVARLINSGLSVMVEAAAGRRAFFSDDSYRKAGAEIISDAAALLAEADVLLKVGPPGRRDGEHEVELLRKRAVLIGFLNPIGNPSLVRLLVERRITAFSMELIPRITRAQGMDALTSQASVAGYKAVLIAANELGRFFPMLTTAAGTIPSARVLVLGAGVAGLQAIATARRLGAVVEAFDIRPEVKEEVQSLGAKFLEVELEEETTAESGYAREISDEAKRLEREMLAEHVGLSDVIITTAAVPGKRAPMLLTEEMVASMKPGSVIVDLAAEQGGNCALTQAGKDVVYNEVKIIGPVNLPSTMPVHASKMYSRNIYTLLMHITRNGELNLDFEDEIINGACITHEGIICNETIRSAVEEG